MNPIPRFLAETSIDHFRKIIVNAIWVVEELLLLLRLALSVKMLEIHASKCSAFKCCIW